jgi:hypothetical protein
MPFTKNALETYWNLNLGQNGSLEGSNISKADNKHSLSLPTTSATRIAIAHIRSRYRTTSTIKPPTTHFPLQAATHPLQLHHQHLSLHRQNYNTPTPSYYTRLCLDRKVQIVATLWPPTKLSFRRHHITQSPSLHQQRPSLSSPSSSKLILKSKPLF